MPLAAHLPGTMRFEGIQGLQISQAMGIASLLPWSPATEHLGHLMAPGCWTSPKAGSLQDVP